MWSRPGGRHDVALPPRDGGERGSQLPLSLVLRCGVRGESPTPPNLRRHPQLSPNDTRALAAPGRNAGSAETESPPAAAHAQRRARRGAPRPGPEGPRRGRRKEGVCADGEEGGPGAHATAPDIPKRLHLGGRRRPRPPATPQPRESQRANVSFPIDGKATLRQA